MCAVALDKIIRKKCNDVFKYILLTETLWIRNKFNCNGLLMNLFIVGQHKSIKIRNKSRNKMIQQDICNMCIILCVPQCVNSLWPVTLYGDIGLCHYWLKKWLVAWRHQANTLNWCWFLLCEALGAIWLGVPQLLFYKICWKIMLFKISATYSRGQWVNSSPPSAAYLHQ